MENEIINNTIEVNPIQVNPINNPIDVNPNKYNFTNICEIILKNKLYLIIGIIILGLLIYYLYNTYFLKNKQSLLNFRKIYNKSNKSNIIDDDESSDDDIKKNTIQNTKHKKNNKKVVFKDININNDKYLKKSNKNIIIESDNDDDSKSEPDHIHKLDLTQEEIDMINNNLDI